MYMNMREYPQLTQTQSKGTACSKKGTQWIYMNMREYPTLHLDTE